MWSDNKNKKIFSSFIAAHKSIWRIIAFWLTLYTHEMYICKKPHIESTYWVKKCDNENNTLKIDFSPRFMHTHEEDSNKRVHFFGNTSSLSEGKVSIWKWFSLREKKMYESRSEQAMAVGRFFQL
jgi:hypothetical protein